MKSLFNSAVKDEILSRIDKLKANSKAEWGKMNVNQNLRHMSLALEIAMGNLNPTLAKARPMPKWLLKFFLLNMKPPRGKVETFKETDIVANQINPTDFEAERENLKQTIEIFFTSSNLVPENKFAGKFSKEDWGKLNYSHTDHHLRQFGV